MTGRILGGFLAVLTAVLAALVVPLGLAVTAQRAHDFISAARTAARAISAVAEEHLDDNASIAGLQTVLDRFAAGGDGAAVLDSAGRTVALAGPTIAPGVLTAARAGTAPSNPHDMVAVSAPVGDAGRSLGHVVLVRGTASLEHQRTTLWALLAGSSVAALVVGAVVAWSLSRWIGRPLNLLAGAAHGIGAGDTTRRADDHTGPPQVREVAGAFNIMADRVAALLETQRGMTAEVSHQLRTPLAALRLRLELLSDELSDTHVADVAAMIDETSRLARLVDGLLAIARAEAIRPSPTPTDLRALTADRLTAWEPVAADQNVALHLDATDAAVLATPGHLEQILDNLLDNAIEATPPHGRVVLTVRPTGRAASLVVADSGPGMSREQQAYALDRYVTDRAGNGGTGLGLAVVSRLAAADRGTVEMRETPGGGLTVEITLPVARD